MSNAFNHILKCGHAMPIFNLVHLTFYESNAYFVKWIRHAFDFIIYGIIWLLAV
jgi:hypothetical protein